MPRPMNGPDPHWARYLEQVDRRRAAALATTLAGMNPWERALVREAAVMGYVRGTQALAGEKIPADSAIVDDVVSACLTMGDLYPTLASLSGPVPSARHHERFATDVLALHRPVCATCALSTARCACAAAPQCATCTTPGTGVASVWPCATVGLLGRLALCESPGEQSDGTARPCTGFLVFRPSDAQARCLTCRGWCGKLVAKYLDITAS